MIEFFVGFIVGVTSVVLSGLTYFVIKEPDFDDKDYNIIEKSIADFVDNKNDIENYFDWNFIKEGTK